MGRCTTVLVALCAVLAGLGCVVYQQLEPLYFKPFHTPFNLPGRDGAEHAFCNFDRHQCCDGVLHHPTSVEDVQRIVKDAAGAGRNVRVVGAGHSMSPLVCGGADAARLTLLSLDAIDRVLLIDRSAGVVTVEAGKRLKNLNAALTASGMSLHNMGLIDEQAIAGLTATGVHGTGIEFGTVSTAVRSMDVVLANGTVATFSREANPDVFKYARLHLGIFGVVVRLSLAIRPLPHLRRAHVYTTMDAVLAKGFGALARAHRHFQVWYIPYTGQALMNEIDEVPEAEALPLALTPWGRTLEKVMTDVSFLLMSALCKVVDGVEPFVFKLLPVVIPAKTLAGPAPDILTFPGINYHSVRYTETEYFVPIDKAGEAFRAVENYVATHTKECPVNAFHPIRTVKGDDIPHAPTHGADTVAMSFVLVDRPAAFDRCSRALEEIFWRFDGRPHWGKRHSLTHARAVSMYGRAAITGLASAAASVDPSGVFMTPELRAILHGP